ncbi:MAG: EAL and HDOD domain-containing protein, partial [Bryobacteraceae bacterium]
WRPLVELATYVKLDVRAQDRVALEKSVRQLRRFRATLLAEKVESEEEMEFCAGLGFELFQGYYLRRPETLSARRAPLSDLALMLVERLADPKTTLDQITHIIAQDAALTFRLLRLANSAKLGHRTRIESVRQAVMCVGVNTILQWALLMVMAGIEGCPAGYLETALHRARTCELLAERESRVRADEAYIVGLLSLLDSMLGAPLDYIVGSLPLADQILRALLHRQGQLGRLLAAVESYESGEPNADIQKAFWDGADHARSVMRSVSTALA